METLREKIDMPGNLSLEIIAGIKTWDIEFVIFGPDLRYNPGVAILSPYRTNLLLDALKEALKKMNALKERTFSGKYHKSFFSSHDPRFEVEVQAYEGEIFCYFSIGSSTGCLFNYPMSSVAVAEFISKLEDVPLRAKKLIDTLNSMH